MGLQGGDSWYCYHCRSPRLVARAHFGFGAASVWDSGIVHPLHAALPRFDSVLLLVRWLSAMLECDSCVEGRCSIVVTREWAAVRVVQPLYLIRGPLGFCLFDRLGCWFVVLTPCSWEQHPALQLNDMTALPRLGMSRLLVGPHSVLGMIFADWISGPIILLFFSFFFFFFSLYFSFAFLAFDPYMCRYSLP